jgi:hypothetical protein
MGKYYVGDVGTEILVETGSPIATAFVKKLYVKKPSGEEVTWDADFGPPNAQGILTSLKYIVADGDWNEPGNWTLQAYVELPEWQGRGDSVKFKLEPPFK